MSGSFLVVAALLSSEDVDGSVMICGGIKGNPLTVLARVNNGRVLVIVVHWQLQHKSVCNSQAESFCQLETRPRFNGSRCPVTLPWNMPPSFLSLIGRCIKKVKKDRILVAPVVNVPPVSGTLPKEMTLFGGSFLKTDASIDAGLGSSLSGYMNMGTLVSERTRNHTNNLELLTAWLHLSGSMPPFLANSMGSTSKKGLCILKEQDSIPIEDICP